jgi:hypothetical protein
MIYYEGIIFEKVLVVWPDYFHALMRKLLEKYKYEVGYVPPDEFLQKWFKETKDFGEVDGMLIYIEDEWAKDVENGQEFIEVVDDAGYLEKFDEIWQDKKRKREKI